VRTVQLVPKALSDAGSWIIDRRAEWDARADRLEDYLQTMKKNGEK